MLNFIKGTKGALVVIAHDEFPNIFNKVTRKDMRKLNGKADLREKRMKFYYRTDLKYISCDVSLSYYCYYFTYQYISSCFNNVCRLKYPYNFEIKYQNVLEKTWILNWIQCLVPCESSLCISRRIWETQCQDIRFQSINWHSISIGNYIFSHPSIGLMSFFLFAYFPVSRFLLIAYRQNE